jgi:hypothetical protein
MGGASNDGRVKTEKETSKSCDSGAQNDQRIWSQLEVSDCQSIFKVQEVA